MTTPDTEIPEPTEVLESPDAVEAAGAAESRSWFRDPPSFRGTMAPGWRFPLAVAVVSMLGASIAIVLTRRFAGNPFAPDADQPWVVSAVTLFLVAAVMALAAPERYRRWIAPAGVVASATWAAGFLTAQLAGTPFSYFGVVGDTGRISAMATRYTVSLTSADPIVDGTPSEYPPLFLWFVGRSAALLDYPAWKLLAPAGALVIALSLVLGWLLWRRLIGDLSALIVTVVAVTAAGADPRKSYEVAALAIMLPWLISTFMRLAPADGGFNWLTAGAVGGFMLMAYHAYLLFSALAMVGLIALNLLRSPRWPYLRHLVLTAVTSFLVALPYLGPWLWALATRPSSQVSDEFVSAAIASNAYFLPWKLADQTFALVVLATGFALWYARRTVWAPMILAMLASNYIYRAGAMARFNDSGHTLFLQYTHYTIIATIAAGTVLGVRELWMRGSRTLRGSWPRAVAVVLVGLLCGEVVLSGWHHLSAPVGVAGRAAHAELLPDLRPTRYHEYVEPMSQQMVPFPAEEARREIDRFYGDYALPVVLSDSERLFAYYPMLGFMGRERLATNSLQTWDDRYAELVRLTKIKDPAVFANESEATKYGTIDVFLLRGKEKPNWLDVRFREEQFDPRWFKTVDLTGRYTLFMRRDAEVRHQQYPR